MNAADTLCLPHSLRFPRKDLSGGVGDANGSFAKSSTPQEARRQSYELRMMVEPAGLLLTGFRADQIEMSEMRARHVAMMSNGRILSRRDVFDIDASFHEMLARFSGNEAVLEVIRQQNRLRRLMEYQSYPDAARVWAWSGEHLAVIDALLGDDRPLASSRLAQHLRNAMSQTNNGTIPGSRKRKPVHRSFQ